MPYRSILGSQYPVLNPFDAVEDSGDENGWGGDEEDNTLYGVFHAVLLCCIADAECSIDAMDALGRDTFEGPPSDGGTAPLFDGHSVPPTLEADDAMVQSSIHASVMNVTQPDLLDDKYNDMQVRTISLSKLRRMYCANDEKGALGLLRKKHRLKIDAEYCVDSEDKDLLWHITEVCCSAFQSHGCAHYSLAPSGLHDSRSNRHGLQCRLAKHVPSQGRRTSRLELQNDLWTALLDLQG